MKTLKELLSEKRSHPDLNPVKFAFDELAKYKGKNNIFITYTSINKVGINPRNDFNTPTAIYAYPLAQIWSELAKKKSAREVPFAGSRPYIQVIEHSGKGEYIHDLSTKYTKAMYDRDMEKLRKMFYVDPSKKSDPRLIFENQIDKLLKKIEWVGKEIKKIKDFDSKIGIVERIRRNIEQAKKDVTMNPKDFPTGTGSFIHSRIQNAIDVFYELEAWILKNDTYALSKKDKFVQSVLIPTRDAIFAAKQTFYDIDRAEVKEGQEGTVEWSIKEGAAGARDGSWGGKFWNTTRLCANDHRLYGNKKAVGKWNKILRELGYAGMADRSGKGIIHPAEPTQAIFLSKSAIKHIETIENKVHSRPIPVRRMQTIWTALAEKVDGYQKGGVLRYDIQAINDDIYNKLIMVDRKEYKKAFEADLYANPQNWLKNSYKSYIIIAYLIYNKKLDVLSKSEQKKALKYFIDRSAMRPLATFSLFGIKRNPATTKKLAINLMEYAGMTRQDIKRETKARNLNPATIMTVYEYLRFMDLYG